MKWKIICSNKDKGGMGVKCLGTLNKALLAKWIWMFTNEDNLLWKNIISLKYGVDMGGWFTNNGKGAFGVGLWKDINKEATVLKQFSNFVVGYGKHVRFWKDTWCGSKPLSETFHNIYTMPTKDVFLANLWDWVKGWNPIFLWSFNGWEIEDVLNLLVTIQVKRLNPDRKIAWSEASPRVAFLLLSPSAISSWEGVWRISP